MELSQKEIDELRKNLGELRKHLRFLLRAKPLIRKDWDTNDFEQELMLKYFKNICKTSVLTNDEHKANLLKMMANQLSNDKLRTLQRKKRDVKRTTEHETRLVIDKSTSYPDERISKNELLGKAKSKLKDYIWKVLEWRSEGVSWDKCADDIGYSSPAALRLRVKRHVDTFRSQNN